MTSSREGGGRKLSRASAASRLIRSWQLTGAGGATACPAAEPFSLDSVKGRARLLELGVELPDTGDEREAIGFVFEDLDPGRLEFIVWIGGQRHRQEHDLGESDRAKVVLPEHGSTEITWGATEAAQLDWRGRLVLVPEDEGLERILHPLSDEEKRTARVMLPSVRTGTWDVWLGNGGNAETARMLAGPIRCEVESARVTRVSLSFN